VRLEYQILGAVILDLLVGDPRWLLHPVRGIGWLAARIEAFVGGLFGRTRTAGIVTALAVIGITAGCACGVLILVRRLHPIAGDLASVAIIYTTIAARDLARHSMAVYRALGANDILQARSRVAMMVGRDTNNLDEEGIIRATVESVAESIVDGVTAPLFFAAIAGPVGAIVYRAINTLDSTFGYENDPYLKFGWASARLDDAANYIPARLTAPLVCVAAAFTLQRPVASLRVLLLDGRNHPSPNAGLPQAAVAGALGVQLGGLNYYCGEPVNKPTIGQSLHRLARAHIPRANALMFVTAILFLVVLLGVRSLVLLVAETWRATS